MTASSHIPSRVRTSQIKLKRPILIHRTPEHFPYLERRPIIRQGNLYNALVRLIKRLEHENVDATLQRRADGLTEVCLRVDRTGLRIAVVAPTITGPASLADHEVDLVGTTGDVLYVAESGEGLVEEIRCGVFDELSCPVGEGVC